MRRSTLCCIIVTATLMIGPAMAADYLVISDFMLIDGTDAQPRSVAQLVAQDGVIVALSDKGEATGPEATGEDTVTQLRLDGAWVMPGLVDTHVHVARFPGRSKTESILRDAVRGGVTSVRDLGGDARLLAATQRALSEGEIVGPTIVYSGLYGGPEVFESNPISHFGFGRTPGRSPWLQAVEPDMDLRLAIARTSGAGATGIKIYGNLDAALAGRIIEEAGRQGLQTWSHATVFTAGPRDLVAAGIDSLSHAPYLVWAGAEEIPADFGARTAGPWDSVAPDHPDLMAVYREMAEAGVFLDATLYVYDQMQNFSPDVPAAGWAREAFEWGAKATALAHEAGVRITVGTDWFEPTQPGGLPHTHDELVLLVEHAGLTPLEAIVAGTRNGAAAAGIGEQRGTIEVGKAADLLVLEANPLEDIANTRNIRWVIKDGLMIR